MKVGILGSSHSTGYHIVGDNERTPKFTDVIDKHKKSNYTFYNCANGGMGSENFLNSIVHLKSTYDIDVVLLELVRNRKNVNLDVAKTFGEKTHSSLSSKRYQRALENSTSVKDLSNVFEFPKIMSFRTWLLDISKDYKIKTLQKFQTYIANNEPLINFWTQIDFYHTLKLCKMLNIKTITWKAMPEPLKHENEIQELVDIDISFNGFQTSVDFIKDKYKTEDVLCDPAHLKPEYEEEIIKDFFLPAIESF